MMNMNEIALELAKREGKKREVNITQIRELLRCLSDMAVVDPSVLKTIEQSGQRRARYALKKKRK